MQKLAELEATAPKVTKKKILNEDSATTATSTKRSLKDVFNELRESIPPGVKPLPVLDPTNKQAGMGFVTSTNPSVQNMLKNLDPKEVQIVQAPGQPGQPQVGQQQQQQQPTGQPAQAGATGQPQQGQMQMKENESDGYQTGVRAYKDGLPRDYNPYVDDPEMWDSPEAEEWDQGWDDAADGVVKEEQLDEISQRKLNAYYKKAGDDARWNDRVRNALYPDEYDPDEKTYLDKKIAGRVKSLNVAGDKLQGRAKVNAKGVRPAVPKDPNFDPWKGRNAPPDSSVKFDSNGNPKRYGPPHYQFYTDEEGTQLTTRQLEEGAKVDRMVKHIEKSERDSGKSKEKASDIAWATANKRGMLDNKNKKKVKEADIPSTQGIDTMGAGLGAGRSATTLESKESKEHKYEVCYTTTTGSERKTTITAPNIEDATKQVKKKFNFDSLDSIKKIKEEKKAVEEGTKGVNPFAKKDAKASAKGKKPDFLDLDKDGDKKESMKKAVADKKKVKESMNHRISAARLEGKTHGLRGHAHHGKAYEDLDEMRAYHEGYKAGLDELYEMGMYETAPAATVPGMARNSLDTPLDEMYDDMEEGALGEMDKTAYMKQQAIKTPGNTFKAFGQTMHDKDVLEGDFAFEAWDRQLNSLINEGLSVSISKGQQNSPDSVTITAQDQEAEHLLAFVKNAGLGLFGDDKADMHSSAMSIPSNQGAPGEVGASDMSIDVVDGHDGMLGLMQKLSGIQSGDADDYADEEDRESEEYLYGNEDEEPCNECGGMMEQNHSCRGKMDEVETPDQMEFKVAEANAPDSGEAESTADEDAEAKEDAALAGADSGDEEEMNESFFNLLRKFDRLAEAKKADKDDEDDEDEDEDSHKLLGAAGKAKKSFGKEQVDEWANNAGPGKTVSDTTFEQDIEFMTKVISGGLNKPKSTGQTTVPVVASQLNRLTSHNTTGINESISDWKKLAGIK